ncbi:excisionase family DNA-binding protein [Marispirochaeta aestuarii]|uniref:excisionase family DNA-binding protein n=1 Tax=Marispirochaeta aestuarii TaxID=1963862 RepID=UPI0038B2C1C4
MAIPIPKLYTYREAAQRLTISESYLRQKVMRREIPFQKIGRSVRFTEDDLQSVIRSFPAGGAK